MKVQLICRVCGREFTAPRFDAKTCTDTCRSRLHRGGDLAYLDGLTAKVKRAEREMHVAHDNLKAAHREIVAAKRAAREERRKLKQQKAEQERQRFLDEITGRAFRKLEQQQEEERRRRQQMSVAGCLKLFAMERRSDMSAEAIAAFLDSEHYPVEDVAAALADLKASGEYDRIIAAEARPHPGR